MRRSLVTAALIVAAGAARAETCDYFDTVSGASGTESCSVTWHDTGATFRLSGATFEWVEHNRQGQWSTGLLNGHPAARYEIDRTRYAYSTLDLTLFLDTSE